MVLVLVLVLILAKIYRDNFTISLGAIIRYMPLSVISGRYQRIFRNMVKYQGDRKIITMFRNLIR